MRTDGFFGCRLALVGLIAGGLLLPATAMAEVEITNLGPLTYYRNPGKPTVYTTGFPGVAGDGVLYVENSGVTSAVIRLNGQVVATPNQFKRKVISLDLPVQLLEENQIEIELRGKPGTSLSVTVSQAVEGDGAAVIGAEGGVLQPEDGDGPLAGVLVEIPAGAISERRVFRIVHKPDEAMSFDPEKEDFAHRVSFSLLPDSELFEYATIRIVISDGDSDGIADDTGLPVATTRLYYLAEESASWINAYAVVDLDAGVVEAQTKHFSVWTAFQLRFRLDVEILYGVDSLPENTTAGVSAALADIQQAFDAWSDALDRRVTFRRSSVSDADVCIRALDLCDRSNGLGLECETAALEARPYQLWGTGYGSTVTVNARTDWMWWNSDYASYDNETYLPHFFVEPFLRTMLHEFGHVVGLPDYTDKKTRQPANYFKHDDYPTTGGRIMYYEWGASRPLTVLSPWDIAQARVLYGLDTSLSGWGAATIDGDIGSWEWRKAGTYSFDVNLPNGGTTPATLYVMNDSANLHVALDMDGSGITEMSLVLVFDEDFDDFGVGDDAIQLRGIREPSWPGDVPVLEDYFGLLEGGAVTADHDDDHGGTNDGGVAIGWDGSRMQLEGWHPLDSGDFGHDFSLRSGDLVGVDAIIVQLWDTSSRTTADTWLEESPGWLSVRIQ